MKELVFPRRQRDGEFQVYHCGMEQCQKGHSYGPAVRDHYLLHFVSWGTGEYVVGEQSYQVRSNQAFLITPGVVTFYQADQDNPWCYWWIGLNGSEVVQTFKQLGVTQQNPIITFPEHNRILSLMSKLLHAYNGSAASALTVKGLAYQVLGEITLASSGKLGDSLDKCNNYLSKATEFIEQNYSLDIKIRDVAKYLGLNRSYFSTLFQQELGVSPQQYLMRYRVSCACKLLQSTDLSVGDIARSVGYTDQFNFSKAFKKVIGTSPKSYRSET